MRGFNELFINFAPLVTFLMIMDISYIGIWAFFLSVYQEPEFCFDCLWLFFRREKLILVLRFDLAR
jgi:hypothetical protein